jgi:hypothetical protein
MVIPPVILASLLSSAPALIQSGVQFGKSLGEEDLTRPDLSIPESAKEALGIQRTLASNRNPMGYEAAINKIDQSVNNAITGVRNAGGSLTDKMSAIADLNMKRGMALSDLDISAGKDYVSRLSSLTSGLNNYAAQEARIQQDELQKFQAESAARLARDTAAKQNLQNALGAIGQGVATNIAFNQNMDLMGKQFANQKELEQMKLDAYRSMLSGGSNQGQNTNQTVNPQVAQSDASISTGVLAPTGSDVNALSDNAVASLFPYVNNGFNSNLGPYSSDLVQANRSNDFKNMMSQMGSSPFDQGEFGPLDPNQIQRSNNFSKMMSQMGSSPFDQGEFGPLDPNQIQRSNNFSKMMSQMGSSPFDQGEVGVVDPNVNTPVNSQVNKSTASQFVNNTDQIVYDDKNKILYLPKVSDPRLSPIDSTYISYLKQRYPGYKIR